MKRITFLLARCYTLFVTFFWSACCFILFTHRVTWEEKTLLGIPLYLTYLFMLIAVVIGFLDLFYWKGFLPKYDSVLSILVPPVVGREAIQMVEYYYVQDKTFDIPIGFCFFVVGMLIFLILLINTIRYLVKTYRKAK